MLRGQQRAGAENVLEELYCQVLQVVVTVKILQQHIVLIKLSIISDKATWPCLVTQCLSTDSTLMVAAELVIDIFLLAASRKESLEAF